MTGCAIVRKLAAEREVAFYCVSRLGIVASSGSQRWAERCQLWNCGTNWSRWRMELVRML
jgi:hypothetical protein